MKRQVMSAERFDQIRREAAEMEQLEQTPGWWIIAGDLREQMETIEHILVQNRLRTYEETVTTRTGTRTTITTAETQIAENAGMYKLAQRVFELVERVKNAPSEVLRLEQQGRLTIEKQDTKEQTNEEVSEHG